MYIIQDGNECIAPVLASSQLIPWVRLKVSNAPNTTTKEHQGCLIPRLMHYVSKRQKHVSRV
jgi:hypothetical protein